MAFKPGIASGVSKGRVAEACIRRAHLGHTVPLQVARPPIPIVEQHLNQKGALGLAFEPWIAGIPRNHRSILENAVANADSPESIVHSPMCSVAVDSTHMSRSISKSTFAQESSQVSDSITLFHLTEKRGLGNPLYSRPGGQRSISDKHIFRLSET
jgi:hypothetical protein